MKMANVKVWTTMPDGTFRVFRQTNVFYWEKTDKFLNMFNAKDDAILVVRLDNIITIEVDE